jgi:hypothetical protein
MELVGALLRGLVIGFSIAAPVGPIGVLCIRRTLSDGRSAGFLCGLGAACARRGLRLRGRFWFDLRKRLLGGPAALAAPRGRGVPSVLGPQDVPGAASRRGGRHQWEVLRRACGDVRVGVSYTTHKRAHPNGCSRKMMGTLHTATSFGPFGRYPQFPRRAYTGSPVSENFPSRQFGE